MLVWPLCRSTLIARLRRVAMFSGPRPVRIFEASSRKAVSRTKCSRFSMTHCDRARCPMTWGDACWSNAQDLWIGFGLEAEGVPSRMIL